MATFTSGLGEPAPEIDEENMQIADKNYFLDAEGNVTTDEDEAQIRLINKGQEIPAEMVEKYGDFNKVAQADPKARQTDTAKAEAAADDATVAPKSAKASSNKAKTAAKKKAA